MKTSDWILIMVTIATAAINIGIVYGKLSVFEKRLVAFEKELRRILKRLNRHHYRIKNLERKHR